LEFSRFLFKKPKPSGCIEIQMCRSAFCLLEVLTYTSDANHAYGTHEDLYNIKMAHQKVIEHRNSSFRKRITRRDFIISSFSFDHPIERLQSCEGVICHVQLLYRPTSIPIQAQHFQMHKCHLHRKPSLLSPERFLVVHTLEYGLPFVSCTFPKLAESNQSDKHTVFCLEFRIFAMNTKSHWFLEFCNNNITWFDVMMFESYVHYFFGKHHRN
jgi:hypothetical protein